MRDIELYEAILGLTPPWKVAHVELNVAAKEVTIRVDAGPSPFPCPECGAVVGGYDSKFRRWRHLDTCQFVTWIEAEVPRVECPQHGVKQVRAPWAEPGSQFTALFERVAIDLLRECSVAGAADLLRISWDEAWGIKKRAVRRGLARRAVGEVKHVGVDEKAVAKGHTYLTVVADLDRGQVLYLAEGRNGASLDGFWEGLGPAGRRGIEAIAMDMWEPYIQSTRRHVPGAEEKIVFDKFHIVKHLHEAVDRVRRVEQRALKGVADDRLTGTKYLWLMRPQDMSREQRARFRELCAGGPAGSSRMGLEGAVSAVVGVPLRGGGAAVPPAVVLAGHPQSVGADGEGGVADPTSPPERAYLPTTPDHQRGVGGGERHDPMGEEDRPRVPERRALQDSHLLPLRRTRSLPTRKPVEPTI